MGGKVDTDWWTRDRVLRGLERFIEDLAQGDETKLPQSANGYNAMVPEFDRNRKRGTRLYPPYVAILRHFETIGAAWWHFGYLTQVKNTNPKWKLTDEIKEMLYKIADCPYPPRHKDRPKDLPSLKEYARSLGMPEDVTTKWAVQLGLSRVKEDPWSDEELAILDEFGYLSLPHLQRKLKEAGYDRTDSGIANMRKRRMAMKAAPWYSVNSLSKLFGMDAHGVTKWCMDGKLKFEMKGTQKVDRVGSGDTRLVSEDFIREFICSYPNDFELRKVDQLWFLYIVTEGKVKFALSDPSRLTKRMECRQQESADEHRLVRKRGRKPRGPNRVYEAPAA